MRFLISGYLSKFELDQVYYAAAFFVRCLFPKQIVKHIVYNIVVNNSMENLGTCEVIDYNEREKPRSFKIILNRKKHDSFEEFLQTLAHEIVHSKQYAYSNLSEYHDKWKKQSIDSENMDYDDLPWEVEAKCYESFLFQAFKHINKCKHYTVGQ